MVGVGAKVAVGVIGAVGTGVEVGSGETVAVTVADTGWLGDIAGEVTAPGVEPGAAVLAAPV